MLLPRKTQPQSQTVLSWLRLYRSEKIGPITFANLLNIYKTAERALEALPKLSRKKRITIASEKVAQQELEQLEKLGGSLITMEDPLYPDLLRSIPDPPPVVSILGNVNLLKKKGVAIVGTRLPSANALRLTVSLSRSVAHEGYTVVSGMAKGIDTVAHEASIGEEGKSIAVLAGGVDVVYPKSNSNLYQHLKKDGLIMSEAPLTSIPQAHYFPRRNRIISGLSLGTCVVEATRRSGSLHTAQYALDQGREVMACPSSPMHPGGRGSNHLIRSGATLVETPDDMLDILNQSPIHLEERHFLPKNHEDQSQVDIVSPEISLQEKERKHILSLLSCDPVDINDVSSFCDVPIEKILICILEEEFSGNIHRHPDGKISLLASAEDHS